MTASAAPATVKDYVLSGGIRTYYEIHGSGDPLVLLHGGFCTIETWEAQTSFFAEKYRVYLPERRGHGRTADVEGPVTYTAMAQDTIAFMDAVGIRSANLVGWSDGGNVGMLVAIHRPDLVRKLVVISAAANIDGSSASALGMMSAMTLEHLPSMLRDAYQALSPDGPEHIETVFRKFSKLWTTEPNMELTDLEEIQAPTLVMVADDDLVTIEHAAAMSRYLRDSQVAVVPGTDHLLVMEKPDLVNRLIDNFLANEQSPKFFG